jgi:putative ABC transport system permease protein
VDWITRVREALPSLTGDPEQDRTIHAELATHLAERYDDLRALGRTHTEAERVAVAELEAAAASRRSLVRAAARRRPLQPWRRTMRVLVELRQDVRFGARLLMRSPGFTLVSILTLMLAIGATTAIVSVVRAVLLKPLPYPEPDRIVFVWEVSPRGETRNVVSPGNVHDWGERADVFESLGATTHLSDVAITDGDEPIKIESVSMTPSMLKVLGMPVAMGRGFSEEDGVENAPPLALLTHGFWLRRFGGDPAAVGRSMELDERLVTIAGVLPPAFAFPSPEVDVITNLRFDAEDRDERRSHNFIVLARLKPGISPAAADAAMDVIAAGLAREHPQHMTGWSVNVVRAHADTVRDVRPLLLVLTGVVAVVLLTACANLANLQLVRASRRYQEMAVRAAIGAGRGRMFRQLLAESTLLALAGGVAGVGVAAASLRIIVASAPGDIPFMDRVTLDAWVLAVAAAVTIACALLVGLAPALRVARADLRPMLQTTRMRTDRSQQRLRYLLVVAQVALSLVLVVGAGLFVRSFWNLSQVDPGFDPQGVLTVALDLPRTRYQDQASQLALYEQLLKRLNAVPGVAAAGGTTGSPGRGAGMTFSYAIDGRPSSNPSGREDAVPLQGVTRGYFETMRIPVVRGRGFTDADRGDAPRVVLINQALARQYWPEGDAVGARINFRPGQMPWREIVGVVGDTRDEGPAADVAPTIYVPLAQREETWGWMSWQTLVVRAAAGNPLDLVPDVRSAVRAVDGNLPLLDVSTVERALAEGEGRRRMAAGLVGAFAIVALVLGTVGVYGVMSFTVAEQRQEIGIRLALGARPSSVAADVVRRGLFFAGSGVLVGLGAAAATTGVLESLLYEVPATDPVTFVSTALLLLIVATAAAWFPARRAMRVDPISALRDN